MYGELIRLHNVFTHYVQLSNISFVNRNILTNYGIDLIIYNIHLDLVREIL